MSLDVYLIGSEAVTPLTVGTGVFIREEGATRELSEAEVRAKWPQWEPPAAQEPVETETVYHANITHNLGRMASEAGLYQSCWRPDERGWQTAQDLIAPLETGLATLKADPDRFRQFDASNGWGRYEHLVKFVSEYLTACREWPSARIEVSQ